MSAVDADALDGAVGNALEDMRVQPPPASPRATWPRRIVARLSLLAMPLVAVYALLIVFEALTTSFRNRPLDAAMYYSAAAALRANPAANIYNPAVLAQSVHAQAGCALWTGANYLYPPLLAIIFEPLTAIPCDQAIHDWMLCNLGLWAVCTALLVYWLFALFPPEASGARSIRARLWHWLHGTPDTALLAAMGVVALSVLAWPVLQGLLMGQVDLLLLTVLLCVPLLIRRQWYVAAGLLLAFAAMLKLLPALLLVYYLMRGRWRVLLGALLGTALLAALILFAVRMPVLLGARAIFDSGPSVQALSDNEAVVHVPIWIAVELGAPATAPLTMLASRALLALAALLFAAGLLLARYARHPHRAIKNAAPARARNITRNTGELLGYGWAVCAMLLLSPLDWLHYNTLLLLPCVLCSGHLLCERRAGRPVGRQIALLLVAGVLLFLPWSLPLDGPTYAAGPYVAGVALRPLLMLLHPAAVVLLWAISGWMYLRGEGVQPPRHRLRSMPSA